MTFKVDPDTHIDSLEKAEDNVLEGTSHWSCKIATTGQVKRVHSMEDGSMEVGGWCALIPSPCYSLVLHYLQLVLSSTVLPPSLYPSTPPVQPLLLLPLPLYSITFFLLLPLLLVLLHLLLLLLLMPLLLLFLLFYYYYYYISN